MQSMTRPVCLFFGLVLANEAMQQTSVWLATFEQAWTTIRDKHFDKRTSGLDWAAVGESVRAEVKEARSEGELRRAISRMLDKLGHSHVGLIPREEYSLRAGRDGAASAGIELRLIEGKPVVWRVRQGSPAAEAGIRPGWILETAAELKGTLIERTMSATAELRGKEGEEKEIRFVPGGARKLRLGPPSGRMATFGNLPPIPVEIGFERLGEAGYLRISAFFEPDWLQSEMAQGMSACRDCRGFIVDLRGNLGGVGILSAALAGWFLEEPKAMGTLTFRDYTLKLMANPRPEAFEGKLAVLIDELSLSTSEFFAGAMKDLGRGRIFGTRSGGMALPSQIEKLPNGDGLQYTTANYVSAGGEALEGKGVLPDEETPLTQADLLAGRDAALAAALNWIKKDN